MRTPIYALPSTLKPLGPSTLNVLPATLFDLRSTIYPQANLRSTSYCLQSSLYHLPSTLNPLSSIYALPSTLNPLSPSTLFDLRTTIYPQSSKPIYSLRSTINPLSPSTFYQLLSLIYAVPSTLKPLSPSTLFDLRSTIYPQTSKPIYSLRSTSYSL